MKTTTPARQRGAVVILVGFVLIVLIGFAGLVIDLGRLYVAKTELQNAADAAALAGAKFLDGTALGLQKAVHGTNNNDTLNGAIYTAGLHRYDFTSKPVTITIANVSISDCPDDTCTWLPASSVTSDVIAAGKTFLKVDTSATGQQTFNTFLMQVLRIFAPGTASSTQTFGMAVAGRFTIDLAPIGVCALSTIKTAAAPVTNELLELGFRRGVNYNIFDLNQPLGSGPAASDMIWINPIDTPPAVCNPSNSNGNILPAFVCTGQSALNLTTFPATVYRNTGLGTGPAMSALNSRFEIFKGGNACDPASAPPDRNMNCYYYSAGGKPLGCLNNGTGLPQDWMSPAPSRQAIHTVNSLPSVSSFADYGVLWSYSRAVKATTDTPPKAGATFSLNDWNAANGSTISLYGGSAVQSAGGYPTTSTQYSPEQPTGTAYPTPYAQTLGTSFSKYFQGPQVYPPGAANRRVLHLAIIDCSVSLGATACSPLSVLGVGKFFMQVPADLTGCKDSDNGKSCLYTEFGGLVDPLPPAEIKLYR